MAQSNLEIEARFFLKAEDFKQLFNKAISSGAQFKGRYYEITIMYDNSNPNLSFYTPEIDGRLRLRMSKPEILNWQPEIKSLKNESKITWKRRLPKEVKEGINTEEEIEVKTNSEDFENLKLIMEKVLKCPRISSYERYRNVFILGDNEVELTIDEFPYGLMIEFELMNGDRNLIFDWIEKLEFKKEDHCHLSCDDQYCELCRKENIEIKPDILFSDSTMPKIKRNFP